MLWGFVLFHLVHSTPLWTGFNHAMRAVILAVLASVCLITGPVQAQGPSSKQGKTSPANSQDAYAEESAATLKEIKAIYASMRDDSKAQSDEGNETNRKIADATFWITVATFMQLAVAALSVGLARYCIIATERPHIRVRQYGYRSEDGGWDKVVYLILENCGRMPADINLRLFATLDTPVSYGFSNKDAITEEVFLAKGESREFVIRTFRYQGTDHHPGDMVCNWEPENVSIYCQAAYSDSFRLRSRITNFVATF